MVSIKTKNVQILEKEEEEVELEEEEGMQEQWEAKAVSLVEIKGEAEVKNKKMIKWILMIQNKIKYHRKKEKMLQPQLRNKQIKKEKLMKKMMKMMNQNRDLKMILTVKQKQ